MSVVGCSPTTWLQPRAPQELKVEWSVPDASVPPTGVKTIRICLPRLRRYSPRDGPRSSVAWLNPLPPG